MNKIWWIIQRISYYRKYLLIRGSFILKTRIFTNQHIIIQYKFQKFNKIEFHQFPVILILAESLIQYFLREDKGKINAPIRIF